MARLKPDDRKAQIINTALRLAERQGYKSVTREAIATELGIAPSLITSYYGTMECFRRTLMRAAVAQECVRVIAQGLADGNPHAVKAPDVLKERASRSLVASYVG